jgi:hypothetical protein
MLEGILLVWLRLVNFRMVFRLLDSTDPRLNSHEFFGLKSGLLFLEFEEIFFRMVILEVFELSCLFVDFLHSGLVLSHFFTVITPGFNISGLAYSHL